MSQLISLIRASFTSTCASCWGSNTTLFMVARRGILVLAKPGVKRINMEDRNYKHRSEFIICIIIQNLGPIFCLKAKPTYNRPSHVHKVWLHNMCIFDVTYTVSTTHHMSTHDFGETVSSSTFVVGSFFYHSCMMDYVTSNFMSLVRST